MIVQEWSVTRDDGKGWHDVFRRDVKLTRSGNVDSRSGIRMVYARVFGASRALETAKALARMHGDRLDEQQLADLAAPAAAADESCPCGDPADCHAC